MQFSVASKQRSVSDESNQNEEIFLRKNKIKTNYQRISKLVNRRRELEAKRYQELQQMQYLQLLGKTEIRQCVFMSPPELVHEFKQWQKITHRFLFILMKQCYGFAENEQQTNRTSSQWFFQEIRAVKKDLSKDMVKVMLGRYNFCDKSELENNLIKVVDIVQSFDPKHSSIDEHRNITFGLLSSGYQLLYEISKMLTCYDSGLPGINEVIEQINDKLTIIASIKSSVFTCRSRKLVKREEMVCQVSVQVPEDNNEDC